MKYIDEIITNNKTKKISNHQTGGIFVIKSNARVFGIDLINEILKKQNIKNVIYRIKEDGMLVNRNDALISFRGTYDDVVSINETCKNILSDLSSLITTLDKYLQEIKDLNVKIAFLENTIPGIGEYYNQAIEKIGGVIIDKKTNFLASPIWLKENINDLFIDLEQDTYVEVTNMLEFNQALISNITNIVCVDFSKEDLAYVASNKMDKKIGLKTNMTVAEIHSYASKNIDFVIIDNFYANIKKIEVKFKYFIE